MQMYSSWKIGLRSSLRHLRCAAFTAAYCGETLHRDWSRNATATSKWRNPYVVLYFSEGGAHVDASGTVKQVPKGTMCLLHGFDGVHAGAHRPEYLHGAFADSFGGVGAVDATGMTSG